MKWLAVLQAYASPNTSRAAFELFVTLILFVACWVGVWATLSASWTLAMVLAFPAAALLVRLFMIQHDCGHGSFLRARAANDWLGRVLGVLTLTPYDDWKHAHAQHHASSGNLDRRGVGDIDTLTVAEYAALPRIRQIAYRLYRHPLVMFGLGPVFLFGLCNRLPSAGNMRRWKAWISPMLTNIAVLAVVVVVVSQVGLGPFLRIQIPIWIIASTAGVWLFFVQHQFEQVYWMRSEGWSRHAAALYGSSHYALPAPLRWMTANIGVHHVHHLVSRIPSYRLQDVVTDNPALGALNRISLLESLLCVRLALFDEAAGKLISFKQYRRLAGSPDTAVPTA